MQALHSKTYALILIERTQTNRMTFCENFLIRLVASLASARRYGTSAFILRGVRCCFARTQIARTALEYR